MINILFAAVTERWDQYQQPLKKELDLTGLEYKLSKKLPPSEVDYIIYAPNSSIQDFSVFTKLKAVLNLCSLATIGVITLRHSCNGK